MSALVRTPECLLSSSRGGVGSDVLRVLAAREGNETIRALGFLLPKVLRRCAGSVTFDRDAFESAVRSVPSDATVVLAPSHRSYFDFLLVSYLCFAKPELGLRVPHIAAAEEFGRIPIVGSLLRRARAFYLRRGAGERRPELDTAIARLLANGESLMFFVEGQRSRSRHTLAPKRGFLRALQATGRSFVILPIAVSYERIPEERSFERELRGGRRSEMSLTALGQWLRGLVGGHEKMGNIHLSAGTPLPFDARADVATLASALAYELQRSMVITRMHVRAFLEEAPSVGATEEWLVDAITARGGRVLDAGLPAPRAPSAALRQSLRNQWMHWFFEDALALFGQGGPVADHVRRRGFSAFGGPTEQTDDRVRRLVEELFHPVGADYRLVARSIEHGELRDALSVVRAYPSAHLPHVEDAFRFATEAARPSEARARA